MQEHELNEDKLYQTILQTYENRRQYISAMEKSPLQDSIKLVLDTIEQYTKTTG